MRHASVHSQVTATEVSVVCVGVGPITNVRCVCGLFLFPLPTCFVPVISLSHCKMWMALEYSRFVRNVNCKVSVL